MTKTTEKILGKFDFKRLDSPSFKEDSVREVIVMPILEALGYKDENIERSRAVKHPFVKIGSTKKPVTLVPDYLLKVNDRYACVLDAKAPNEKIVGTSHVEQVYSYAIHPEIRTTYFALCNGREFALYRDNGEKPLLFFRIKELEENWEALTRYLSPSSFHYGKDFIYESVHIRESAKFDYLHRPLPEELPVKKRSTRRHFGVHGYFTKQSWNIVQDYIRNFTQPGDLVFDPFGGSGVTAIEALMCERKSISIDINPLAVFIVNSLIAPVNQLELVEAFNRVKSEYVKKEPKTKEEIKAALKKYPYPKGFTLPKASDVKVVEELFSDRQLAQLACLKHIIKKEKDDNIRNSLLLMFSGLLTKVNLTYHTGNTATRDGQGNASAFQYYRYRIAPSPKDVDVITYFELRFNKIRDAKKEMEYYINERTIKNINVYKGTATKLEGIKRESIDYIYTDPPYGNKIQYLDLSVMWTAWLDLKVSKQDLQDEAIEGGEENKSKDEYNKLIAQSIEEMYRVLKFDRWMSFVFAHKDPEFWHLIIETAERCGFEYAGAVKQGNGQTSFKKRQHPFTVLAGQLIINFRKVRNPKAIMKANLGTNFEGVIRQTIEGIIAKNNGATLEQINDELIIKALELGFLDLMKKHYTDLTPILTENFDYNEKTELYTIKKNKKFQTHIDLNLRVRYYLYSYLKRMEIEERTPPTFDDIVLYIIPLLKNGITPENQTILKVLEDIGEHVGANRWRLKFGGQQALTLF